MTSQTIPTAQAAGVVQPKRSPKARRSVSGPGGLPYALLLPSLAVVALVSVFPIVYALNLSVHTTRFTRIEEFTGFTHYREIFATSSGLAATGRSMLYVVASLVITIPLGLGIATLLNQPVRLRAMFRVVILLPWVISQTVAALLWKWLLNPDYGAFGLGSVAGRRIDLLADPITAMTALIAVNVWISYPLATILSLAALQTIPKELLEAADMDGASRIQRFRRVVLPLMKPTMFVLAIMLTLLYFNMVTLVYTLTGGGPFSGTSVLSLAAFQQSFDFFNLGLGAAYSVVLFIFNVIFGIAYIRLIRGESHAQR
jgi:multiple sugar transport system permease protein